MGDTSKTPWGVLLELAIAAEGVYFLISLDQLDLDVRCQQVCVGEWQAQEARWMVAWWLRLTHVWMSTDLLNDIFVKVARVSHKATSEVVCVLETVEDVVKHWGLRPLLQLSLDLLGVEVEVLDPVVVLGGQVCGDVLLELDHVAVRDLPCVGRGHDGSCIAVDGRLVQHG